MGGWIPVCVWGASCKW